MNSNQAPDQRNTDEDLPGYPHYPSGEDILNPDNGLKKVRGDVEDLANSNAISRRTLTDSGRSADTTEDRNDSDDEVRIVPGTEADVTKDDLILLGDPDADQDLGEDEEIGGRATLDSTDLQGDPLNEDALDIPEPEEEPGTNDVDLGDEDEENNYYSLGGDRQDNLEEERE